HHPDLQRRRFLFKREKFVDVLLLEDGRNRFPGAKPLASFLDLSDRRVERFLPFRQGGLIVIVRNGNGP
ncbi:hypothetical protein VSR34_38175, partial [Paraburkholderia sp. JHI2823]|uniref:hypothetical protein n=1 Tax=Paraburkholderia sp. JHI2823 TaxID=3112960 RepID=UPI0031713A17